MNRRAWWAIPWSHKESDIIDCLSVHTEEPLDLIHNMGIILMFDSSCVSSGINREEKATLWHLQRVRLSQCLQTQGSYSPLTQVENILPSAREAQIYLWAWCRHCMCIQTNVFSSKFGSYCERKWCYLPLCTIGVFDSQAISGLWLK